MGEKIVNFASSDGDTFAVRTVVKNCMIIPTIPTSGTILPNIPRYSGIKDQGAEVAKDKKCPIMRPTYTRKSRLSSRKQSKLIEHFVAGTTARACSEIISVQANNIYSLLYETSTAHSV